MSGSDRDDVPIEKGGGLNGIEGKDEAKKSWDVGVEDLEAGAQTRVWSHREEMFGSSHILLTVFFPFEV